MSNEQERTPVRGQALLVLIALAAAAAVVPFLSTLGVPLHGAEQTLLRAGGPLDHLATAPEAFGEWPGAPLAALSFGITNDFFPGTPSHRFVQLGLHALFAVLVLLCALRMGAAPAWALLAALLAAGLPAVAPGLHYLPSRPISLGLAFALLSLYAALRSADGRTWWLALAALAFLAAAGVYAPFALLPLLGVPFLRGRYRDTIMVLLGLMLATLVAIAAARRASGVPLLAAGLSDAALDTPLAALIAVAMTAVSLAIAVFVPRFITLPQQASYGAAVMAGAGMVVLGWWQAMAWTNPVSFWETRAEVPEQRAEAARYVTEFILAYSTAENTEPLRRAADLLESSMPEQPEPGDAWRLLADAQLGLGDTTAAYAAAEQAVRRDPFSDDSRARLAMLETLRTIPDEAPQDRARRLVGACAPAQGELPEQAAIAYAEALAALGDAIGAAQVMAGVSNPPLALQQQINGAARLVQQAVQRAQQTATQAPASAERFQHEAEAAMLQREFNKAFYWLERLLSTPEPPAKAYGLMASALAGMDSSQSFIDHWGGGLTEAGDWRTAAEASAAFGFWEAAEDYLRHAQSAGMGVSAPVELARMAVAMRQPDKARGYIAMGRAEGAPDTDLVLLEQQLGTGTNPASAVSLP
ncbi:MAG: hypothetical protein GC168_02790 [Candidatus Hydrogenedens sp.]|nr:hypothetical protein [Candidatus Hydrogenedens sp.]